MKKAKTELKKVMMSVLDVEKRLPKYLPAGCELLRVGCDKAHPENYRYIAMAPDMYPVVWDGLHWQLPAPIIVQMIYKARQEAGLRKI
jgi:hypothetical protein